MGTTDFLIHRQQIKLYFHGVIERVGDERQNLRGLHLNCTCKYQHLNQCIDFVGHGK